MIHSSFGGLPHLGALWSGWKSDSLSWNILLTLDPASSKSRQSSIASPGMITRINRDLLCGLAGSFPNFQSIRKITSSSASISIRAFLGNKGRINLTHSLTKAFGITALLLKITFKKPGRYFLTSCPQAKKPATKRLKAAGIRATPEGIIVYLRVSGTQGGTVGAEHVRHLVGQDSLVEPLREKPRETRVLRAAARKDNVVPYAYPFCQ